MNVDVEILADSRENVITVPIEAIQKLKGEYLVTVKDASGNKNDVKVELGLATKDKVEITSGLSEGDIIVYSVVQSDSTQMPPGMNRGVPGVGSSRPGDNAVIRQEGSRP